MWTPAGYGSAGVAFRRILASGSATPAATSGGDRRSRVTISENFASYAAVQELVDVKPD